MTYEYSCVECGHKWEADQKITESPLTECPKCGQQTAQRLISKSNFQLVGPSWGVDGYK